MRPKSLLLLGGLGTLALLAFSGGAKPAASSTMLTGKVSVNPTIPVTTDAMAQAVATEARARMSTGDTSAAATLKGLVNAARAKGWPASSLAILASALPSIVSQTDALATASAVSDSSAGKVMLRLVS